LTPEIIAALAQKHGIACNAVASHRKALTAGSDDHGHRRSGTIYTEVDGVHSDPATFLDGCMAGDARTVGQQAHLATMATCVNQTTYRHIKQEQAAGAHLGNPFLDLMDLLAGREPPAPTCARAAGFMETLLAAHRDARVRTGVDILEIPAAAT